MKTLSIFSIAVFFTLAACQLDPTLAGRYPLWIYGAFILSQLLTVMLHRLFTAARLGTVPQPNSSGRSGSLRRKL